MNATLKRQLKNLSSGPGIYEFFSNKDKLLYVGKAKNLPSRIRSYFQRGAELSPAKQLMIAQIHHLTTTEVANETEALLLEKTLIKQYQPSFNIDLRDDKSWLYISIDKREKYPNVEFVRRPKQVKGVKLFGPYVAASSIRSLFPFFKKTLGLKTCAQPPNKPCFQAGLGRCLGHDLDPNSHQRYLKQLIYLEKLLKGDVKKVVSDLQFEMNLAARSKAYERAARLRDQLKAFQKLREKQNVVSAKGETFGVFGLARSGNIAAVVRLPVRRGAMQESDRFLLNQTKGLTDEEVLNGFLEQYTVAATDLAKHLYLPIKLKYIPNSKFSYSVPQKGSKKQLLKLASKAALNHLEQSVTSWQRQNARAKQGLKQLKELLNLAHEPKRIEGYDISNIQGKDAVGSMVVLTNGLPDHKQYRKFKIQSPAKPNDFRMLAEVLVRRFTKNKDWPKPDLVMLDGGAGQLSIVKKSLDQVMISIPLIALAKREELLYLSNNSTLRLRQDAPALLLLESLRDEAHRFGITYYRSRHRKKTVKSAWDELSGIGPKLKKKLKAVFGTISGLRQASEKDLARVVGPIRAAVIKQHLS